MAFCSRAPQRPVSWPAITHSPRISLVAMAVMALGRLVTGQKTQWIKPMDRLQRVFATPESTRHLDLRENGQSGVPVEQGHHQPRCRQPPMPRGRAHVTAGRLVDGHPPLARLHRPPTWSQGGSAIPCTSVTDRDHPDAACATASDSTRHTRTEEAMRVPSQPRVATIARTRHLAWTASVWNRSV